MTKIFTEKGQFGQHLNYQTGAIISGGTISGSNPRLILQPEDTMRLTLN